MMPARGAAAGAAALPAAGTKPTKPTELDQPVKPPASLTVKPEDVNRFFQRGLGPMGTIVAPAVSRLLSPKPTTPTVSQSLPQAPPTPSTSLPAGEIDKILRTTTPKATTTTSTASMADVNKGAQQGARAAGIGTAQPASLAPPVLAPSTVSSTTQQQINRAAQQGATAAGIGTAQPAKPAPPVLAPATSSPITQKQVTSAAQQGATAAGIGTAQPRPETRPPIAIPPSDTKPLPVAPATVAPAVAATAVTTPAAQATPVVPAIPPAPPPAVQSAPTAAPAPERFSTGPNLSTIAQQAGTSVRDVWAANPELQKLTGNPDVLPAGYQVRLPSTTAPVYDKGVGTAADTMARIQSGEYSPSDISTAAYRRATGTNENLDRIRKLAGLKQK